MPARLDATQLADPAGVSPLLRALAEPRRPSAATPSTPTALVLQDLRGMSTSQQERRLLDLVTTQITAVTDHPAHSIDTGRPFRDLGFDSLVTIELRNRLAATTGLALPATVVFDHPTPSALARHLHSLLGLNGGGPEPGGTDSEVTEATIRSALSSIPLRRLREAGLVETLLQLADPPGSAVPADDGPARDLDAMDASDLIRLALDDRPGAASDA